MHSNSCFWHRKWSLIRSHITCLEETKKLVTSHWNTHHVPVFTLLWFSINISTEHFWLTSRVVSVCNFSYWQMLQLTEFQSTYCFLQYSLSSPLILIQGVWNHTSSNGQLLTTILQLSNKALLLFKYFIELSCVQLSRLHKHKSWTWK